MGQWKTFLSDRFRQSSATRRHHTSRHGSDTAQPDRRKTRRTFAVHGTRQTIGERELNYIYLDERHGIAITHPHIAADRLDALYQKHYSSPPTEPKLPEATSPYRQFRGKQIWERLLLSLPVGVLSRILFPGAGSDNTLQELITVLERSKVDTAETLRFLDVGCFEGHLLDQIRSNTCWKPFGLEPNKLAADTAKGKGHQVWCGHAEDAGSLIPREQKFDVIHLGQSIEHVDDPVNVLVHLKRLLAPRGVLVVSTPNLESREIDWFGPTWAHWHPPITAMFFPAKGCTRSHKKRGSCRFTCRPFPIRIGPACHWPRTGLAWVAASRMRYISTVE